MQKNMTAATPRQQEMRPMICPKCGLRYVHERCFNCQPVAPPDTDEFAAAQLAFLAGDFDSAEIHAAIRQLQLRGVAKSPTETAEWNRCEEILAACQARRNERKSQ